MNNKNRKYKPYTFQAHPEDMEVLKRLASHQSVSAMIREAIREYIEKINKTEL